MKKPFFFILAFLAISMSYAQGFSVKNYEVDVHISADGYFDVVENYDIYFTQSKHGIYRDIRTVYDVIAFDDSREKREIKISNIDVPDFKFTTTNSFMRRVEGMLRIKIGDANKTVKGDVHYEVKYRVERAFLHEPDADRFYWNLKPTDWFAQFNKMTFRVHLPDNKAIDEQDYEIFAGPFGTTFPSSEFMVTQVDGVLRATSPDGFTSNYGDAVTILINLAPGTVEAYQPAWPFWTRYGWTLIIGALIVLFYALWKKHGKDDRVPATISYHPPEGLDSAMAGFLINDKEDTADLISLIPYWGARGYLRIEEIDGKRWFSKDDTKLIRLKDLPGSAPSYQRTIFKGLFSSSSDNTVLVRSLHNTFYTDMILAKTQLKKAAQNYYEPKAKSVKKMTNGFLFVLMLILLPLSFFLWGIIAAVALLATFIFLFIMNRYMIKKNVKGSRVYSELKGFKRFIKTAEENKLKMLLKENPTYFESTMGYALSFGAFGVWAKKFEALNTQPPEWYSAAHGGSYHSMNNFSRSFNSSMSSASSMMVSSPSSSGSGGSSGGSSGGGFGGGGGGSW